MIRIPVQPQTVGDHIRKRRLGLKMLQKQVGQQLGVDETSIHNWEVGISKPEIRYMPAIIQFLGYNPLPEPTTMAERLVRHRTTLGLTQMAAAQEISVDQGTLARWERGEREPTGEFLERVRQFLKEDLAFKCSNAGHAG